MSAEQQKRNIAMVILAAGQGSRMKSDLPKVLHKVGAVPMVGHALAAARSLEPDQIVVVAGHGDSRPAGAARPRQGGHGRT